MSTAWVQTTFQRCHLRLGVATYNTCYDKGAPLFSGTFHLKALYLTQTPGFDYNGRAISQSISRRRYIHEKVTEMKDIPAILSYETPTFGKKKSTFIVAGVLHSGNLAQNEEE